jgi:RNA polymerase sigma factor (sigma-70 family)
MVDQSGRRVYGSAAFHDSAVARSGRELAEWLAVNHLPALHAHAHGCLGVLGDQAEDVVGTILCDIACGRLPPPPSDVSPVAYTMGILKKRARHVIRNEARFQPLHPAMAAAAPVAGWDRANRALLRRRMARAMRVLTAGERDVITMRFDQEMSIEEIAALRRTRQQTVKELERRGLRKLRAELCAYRSAHEPPSEGT